MTRGRHVARTALVVLALAALTGCTSDDNGSETPVDLSEIPATPSADDELLCDFLPRQSAVLALGTDGFEVTRGETTRDSVGELSFAACHLTIDGQDDSALDINVDWAMGSAVSGLQEDLNSDRYNQLPESEGLGFTWTDEANRPDGNRGDTAHALLVHGDRLITVWITLPAKGRDGEADAAALARQAVATLEIPDEWTLPDPQPTR